MESLALRGMRVLQRGSEPCKRRRPSLFHLHAKKNHYKMRR